MRIQVCQGESSSFADNTKLGELVLTDLPDAERGEPSIAVTFEINADGLLEVRALDQDTGQEQVATLRVAGELSPDELAAIARRDEFSGGDIVSRPDESLAGNA